MEHKAVHPERKSTTVRLPEELLKAAKIQAVKDGVTLQDLFIEGLSKYLKERGAKL
jgi:predicted DNA binding CopG/RHH family protein